MTDERCHAPMYDAWVCLLPKGHDGAHDAWGGPVPVPADAQGEARCCDKPDPLPGLGNSGQQWNCWSCGAVVDRPAGYQQPGQLSEREKLVVAESFARAARSALRAFKLDAELQTAADALVEQIRARLEAVGR